MCRFIIHTLLAHDPLLVQGYDIPDHQIVDYLVDLLHHSQSDEPLYIQALLPQLYEPDAVKRLKEKVLESINLIFH